MLNWTASDHFGFLAETGVLLKVVKGDWASSATDGRHFLTRCARAAHGAFPPLRATLRPQRLGMDFSIVSILMTLAGSNACATRLTVASSSCA